MNCGVVVALKLRAPTQEGRGTVSQYHPLGWSRGFQRPPQHSGYQAPRNLGAQPAESIKLL